MFWFPTKKEMRRAFKVRDEKIIKLEQETEKLREKIENNSLKIATLEGAYSNLSNKNHSVPVPFPSSPKQSQGTIEVKLMNRIRNNKKSLVIAEILKLMPSHSVFDIYQIIVKERGLCSKSAFYRYINSLQSQKLTGNGNKMELN